MKKNSCERPGTPAVANFCGSVLNLSLAGGAILVISRMWQSVKEAALFTLRGLSLTFAAGAFGGLVNSLALWAAGVYGITAALSVAIAPELTPQWLYPRVVWGGLWGFLFVLPFLRGRWWQRGLLFSLGPTAVQLLVVFPQKTPHGMFGLGLGEWTPLVVFVVNAIWGLAAAALLKAQGSS